MKKTILLQVEDNSYFKKGDIIKGFSPGDYRVVKVYSKTWIRRMLILLGFKVRTSGIKVTPLN